MVALCTAWITTNKNRCLENRYNITAVLDWKIDDDSLDNSRCSKIVLGGL